MSGGGLSPCDLQLPHPGEFFTCPGEVEDKESEWAMFRASITDAASSSCALKIIAPVTMAAKVPTGGHKQ